MTAVESDMLTELARALPLSLLIIAVMVVALLVLGYFLVRKGWQRQEGGPGEAESPGDDSEGEPATIDLTRTAGLRSSFRKGIGKLRRHAAGTDYRYQVPWWLTLGQSGSRRPGLLADAGLTLPFGPPDEEDLSSSLGCAWWLTDRGLVIDLAGEYVLRADGRTANDAGWRLFLGLLQQHRPQRPLDGVIVTVAAADLLAARESAEQQARLELQAQQLYRKLSEAQSRLGLRLPVYLLVTGCERLEGFDPFTAALPDARYGDVLGWSSPYGLDTPYRSDWVDQAFDCLAKRLNQARLGIFAARRESADAERILLFPAAFRALKEPLQSCLTHLLRASTYHETFVFRGLFFCGERVAGGEAVDPDLADELPLHAEEEPPFDESAPRATARRTLFLKDLFERKIFAESKLVAATAGTLLSRNRRVRWAQALVLATLLLAGLGLWRAYGRLRAAEQGLRPLLQGIAHETGQVRRQRERGEQPDAAYLGRQSLELLAGMSAADLRRFGSLAIPSSWFSPLNAELREALLEAFDEVLFPAMVLQLDAKARALSAAAPAVAIAGRGEQVVAVKHLPEFVALEEFGERLTTLEQNVKIYNDLQNTRDLQALSQLLEYLFEKPVPEGFLSEATLYRQALVYVRYPRFRPQEYREAAVARTLALSGDLYSALFDDNAVLMALDHLDQELEIGSLQWRDDDPTACFQRAHDAIRRTETVLRQPEVQWIFAAGFDLGPRFNTVLGLLESSAFLEPELGPEIRNQARAGWQTLQQLLLEQGSPATGPFLGRSELPPPRPINELSPTVVVLGQSLEAFLGQSFLPPAATRSFIIDPPPRTRVAWDSARLARATDLIAAYQSFQQEGLELFPPELRPTVDGAARDRLAANISDLIADAQRFEPLPYAGPAALRTRQTRAAIANFSAAAPSLNKLLSSFAQLQRYDLEQDLGELMAAQAEALMGEVDRLLEAAGLYLPKGGDFSWWDGQAPLAYQAFDVPDAAGLTAYLAAQRDRIGQLAGRYAEPVITALAAADVWRPRTSVLSRWENILTELLDYENQKPGNAIAALETYIGSELPQENLADCSQERRLTPGQPRDSGGFFRQRENFLRRKLSERCRELVRERIVAGTTGDRGYGRIENFFNQRLAGRAPFTDDPAAPGPDADPADLRKFYQLFDPIAELLLAVPEESASFRGAGAEVHAFIARMQEVRIPLASFLASSEPDAVPVVDFEAAFRVNREREIGGNQIIEWRLEVAETTLGNRSPEPRQGRWTLGDEIRLTLRWAEDSPRVPDPGPMRPGVAIADRTVTFSYSNPWSLWTLLAAHRSSSQDFAGFVDPKPCTLRFVVDTVAAETAEETEQAAVEAPEPVPARVFIRLSLIDPESKEPLALPGRFPSQAPPLPAPEGGGG